MFLMTDRFRRRGCTSSSTSFDRRSRRASSTWEGRLPNWKVVDVPSEIVLLNPLVPDSATTSPAPNMHWVQGDGCDLQYADGEFDICFSNSTIEHLHTYGNQQRFAAEVRRVGQSYYVQTPARSFPFEPHWLGFFIHWLPRECNAESRGG